MKEKYPLNGFLKMPGVLEKDRQLEELGLTNDPAKYPLLLPKDEDFANYMRFRKADE